MELINAEKSLIYATYGNLSATISEIKNKITNAQLSCKKIITKRLSEVFECLDFQTKREVISLIKNKFEVNSDKKVKLTFKSAFRKIRKR